MVTVWVESVIAIQDIMVVTAHKHHALLVNILTLLTIRVVQAVLLDTIPIFILEVVNFVSLLVLNVLALLLIVWDAHQLEAPLNIFITIVVTQHVPQQLMRL